MQVSGLKSLSNLICIGFDASFLLLFLMLCSLSMHLQPCLLEAGQPLTVLCRLNLPFGHISASDTKKIYYNQFRNMHTAYYYSILF